MTNVITNTFQKRIAVGVMAIAILFGMMGMSSAQAQTQNDLATQIALLMTQIAMLEAQLTTQADIQTHKIGSVINTTAELRVRDAAAGMAIGSVPKGMVGGIIDGPEYGNGYTWWEIDYQNGLVGWSAEPWLQIREKNNPATLNGLSLAVFPEETVLEPGRLDGIVDVELRSDDPRNTSVQSITLGFENQSGDNATEPFPWEEFDSISFWVKGNKVASYAVNDKNVWKGGWIEKGDRYFFSVRDVIDLHLPFSEDQNGLLNIVIALEVADDAKDQLWNVTVPSVLFKKNSALTEVANLTTVPFTVEKEKSASLTLSLSESNPDATSFIVDIDDVSPEYVVMVFDVEEENGLDAVIDDLKLTAFTTAEDVSAVIDEVLLLVDGYELEAVIPSRTGELLFENLDIDIDADSSVEITIAARFNGVEDYTNGDTVWFTNPLIIAASDELGNDEVDMTITSNGVVSNKYTLLSSGVTVSYVRDEVTLKNQVGMYKLDFEVTAIGEDMYIPVGSAGFVHEVVRKFDGHEVSLANDDETVAVVATASKVGNYYKIAEGETEEFTMAVDLDPVYAGSYKVAVEQIKYYPGDPNTVSVSRLPVKNVDTEYLFIPGVASNDEGSAESEATGMFVVRIEGVLQNNLTQTDVTRTQALNSCIVHIKNAPTSKVGCFWNNELIRYTTKNLGTFTVEVRDSVQNSLTQTGVTEGQAIRLCESHVSRSGDASVKCYWNGKVIYSGGQVLGAATSVTTSTLLTALQSLSNTLSNY